MKKIIALTLTGLMLLTQPVMAADTSALNKSHWAYENMVTAYENDWLTESDSENSPAQMQTAVSALVRALNLNNNGNVKINISDSDKIKKEYSEDMYIALANGIIKADASGKINPERVLTRAEWAEIVAPLIKTDAADSASKFSDVSKTDKSYDAVLKCASAGIISGYKDNTFKPAKEITNAEVATVLVKLEKINSSDVNSGSGENTVNNNTNTTSGSALEVYDIYNKSNEAMADVKSLSMNTDMIISMKEDKTNTEMTMTMTGVIKEVIHSMTDVDMYMDLIADAAGETLKTKGYYTDGVLYMDMNGSKIKTEIPLDKVYEQFDLNNLAATTFPEGAIIGGSVKDLADGTQQLNMEMDINKVYESLGIDLNSMLKSLTGQDVDINYSNVLLSAIVDESGIISSYDMTFSATISDSESSIKVDYTIKMELTDINSTTIEFPDFSEYVSAE